MKAYQTVEEMIGLTYWHRKLSPQDLLAFWSKIPHLLCNSSRPNGVQKELENKLQDIFALTVKEVDNFSPRYIAGVVLDMAKAMKHIHSNQSGKLFHGILLNCDVE